MTAVFVLIDQMFFSPYSSRKFLGTTSASVKHHILQQPVPAVLETSMRTLSSIFTCLPGVELPVSNPTTNPTAGRLLKSETPAMHQCVRTKVRVYYKGSAWKRYNKHNIEKRLTTPGGLEMLWRKTLKGRMNLAAYERILPNTVKSKILPQHNFKYKDHPLTKRRLPKPGLY